MDTLSYCGETRQNVTVTRTPVETVTQDPHRLAPGDLTAARLERLLQLLAPDRAAAAERYNRLRAKLIQFLTWERCVEAEHLADEVINRVARRIDGGEHIENVTGYFLGVARLVACEARDRQTRHERALGEFARLEQKNRTEPVPADRDRAALGCLEACLGSLDAERRRGLLAYYATDVAARIEQRRRLASELGLKPVALRNRMLRLRGRLEKCVENCLHRTQDIPDAGS
jgi:DNA-directed RNA polymerase specialized sigma24 family protein